MIHQPMGGFQGQASDMEIMALLDRAGRITVQPDLTLPAPSALELDHILQAVLL